jgi:hypothetical protein
MSRLWTLIKHKWKWGVYQVGCVYYVIISLWCTVKKTLNHYSGVLGSEKIGNHSLWGGVHRKGKVLVCLNRPELCKSDELMFYLTQLILFKLALVNSQCNAEKTECQLKSSPSMCRAAWPFRLCFLCRVPGTLSFQHHKVNFTAGILMFVCVVFVTDLYSAVLSPKL